MKRILSLSIIFLILISAFTFNASADAAPAVKAKSAIVSSASSGQILYSKDIDKRTSPDGFTKIMTAIVAYDELKPDEVITVPQTINSLLTSGDSTMGLQTGEKIPVRDLVKGMLMKPANDAAFALALAFCESPEDFVNKMNDKATELNLKGTKFTNITGVYDENQYTTAADMLKIYKTAFQNPEIKEILNSANVTIPATNLTGDRVYWTDNHLISRYKNLDYLNENVKGGKVISSDKGGNSAAINASYGDMDIICIVFNSPTKDDKNCALTDSTDLVDYIFKNYSLKTIVKQDSLVCEAKIKNARGGSHILLYANNSLNGLLLNDSNVDEDITTELHLPEKIYAPIKKDQVIGSVDYIYKGNVIDSVNLISLDNVKVNYIKALGNGILWFLNLPVIKAILIALICIVIIYIYLLYKTLQNHKKKMAQKKRRPKPERYDDIL